MHNVAARAMHGWIGNMSMSKWNILHIYAAVAACTSSGFTQESLAFISEGEALLWMQCNWIFSSTTKQIIVTDFHFLETKRSHLKSDHRRKCGMITIRANISFMWIGEPKINSVSSSCLHLVHQRFMKHDACNYYSPICKISQFEGGRVARKWMRRQYGETVKLPQWLPEP